MKISFITTVFNEEKTISQFLTSLFNQSKLPDEIIIVDAGSTDNTIEKISQFTIPQTKKSHKIKLIIKKGNRSVGRNTAIRSGTGDIIVCSDAGCILDEDFVKNITKPFTQNSVDVVSGFYKPIAKNIFEKCLATYTSVMPDKVDKETFLPSSRSMAFKKAAWEKAQGFPENLDTCEDLVFDKNLKKIGATFYFTENAFVYWPQRKNLWEAVKQFFSYAKGDGEARFFRKSTPFLFLRYLIGLSLLSIGIQFSKPLLLVLLGLGFIFYLIWSIWKNFKYINSVHAFFWLPILQVISDIAVIAGTSLGYIKSFALLGKIKRNKTLSVIIFIYIIVELSGITWGIPNSNHPFNYHMDEWAQYQSIRSLFKHGTPNISGASHGAIFQYFLAGIYLIPFILLGLVNPFLIKSPFYFIDMQQRLFEILRLNTILFGVGSILVLSAILRKYWKINPLFGAILFTITPLWITLSNYFKYDIALIFWILVSIFFIFKFSQNPTRKNFILAGFFSGLTLATKLSAIPMFIIYMFSFLLFTNNYPKQIKTFFLGIGTFLVTFLLLGIPDFLLSKKEYLDWWKANVDLVPKGIQNMHLGKPFLLYLFQDLYLGEFGHAFYIIFIASLVFLIFSIFKMGWKKYKKQLFLLVSLAVFLVSLYPLKIFAAGNRSLVLLPFFTLISAISITDLQKKLSKKMATITSVILFSMILFQIAETFSWVSTRIFVDPRESSSEWIEKQLPKGTVIGLETIPIFQEEPDIVLKEFYKYQYNLEGNNKYRYEVIDIDSPSLPNVMIITNDTSEQQLYKKNPKNELVKKLSNMNYKRVARFSPNYSLFTLFNSRIIFTFPLYLTPDTITIYQKTQSN